MTNQDQFKVKVKQCFGDYLYPAGNNWALLEIIQSPFLYIWKITVVELLPPVMEYALTEIVDPRDLRNLVSMFNVESRDLFLDENDPEIVTNINKKNPIDKASHFEPLTFCMVACVVDFLELIKEQYGSEFDDELIPAIRYWRNRAMSTGSTGLVL